MGKSSKDKRDVFYRIAKEENFRARSIFKLIQIDELLGVLDGCTNIVDLCAAPGSWSQALQKIVSSHATDYKILAVDLQEMEPIEGVTTIVGDITNIETAETIIEHFKGNKADIVVCDGAADVTGMHSLDEHFHLYLLRSAFAITTHVLRDGGNFVIKIFAGLLTESWANNLCEVFCDVQIVKPAASRLSSTEAFAVCRGYKAPKGFYADLKHPERIFSSDVDPSWESKMKIRFVMCGDLSSFDSDTTYDTSFSVSKHGAYSTLDPVRPPTNPPYKEALRQKKNTSVVNTCSPKNTNDPICNKHTLAEQMTQVKKLEQECSELNDPYSYRMNSDSFINHENTKNRSLKRVENILGRVCDDQMESEKIFEERVCDDQTESEKIFDERVCGDLNESVTKLGERDFDDQTESEFIETQTLDNDQKESEKIFDERVCDDLNESEIIFDERVCEDQKESDKKLSERDCDDHTESEFIKTQTFDNDLKESEKIFEERVCDDHIDSEFIETQTLDNDQKESKKIFDERVCGDLNESEIIFDERVCDDQKESDTKLGERDCGDHIETEFIETQTLDNDQKESEMEVGKREEFDFTNLESSVSASVDDNQKESEMKVGKREEYDFTNLESNLSASVGDNKKESDVKVIEGVEHETVLPQVPLQSTGDEDVSYCFEEDIFNKSELVRALDVDFNKFSMFATTGTCKVDIPEESCTSKGINSSEVSIDVVCNKAMESDSCNQEDNPSIKDPKNSFCCIM